MKKIIRNVLINILLISPTFYVFWYYKDNEFFRSFLEFCSSAFLWMTGFGLVGFGLVRIVMSAMRLLEKLREIHYNWKHTRKRVQEDDRLVKCSKCNGTGYTYWVNNINGRPSTPTIKEFIMGFAEVALEKGLTIPARGVFEYRDSISFVKYETLTAASEGEIPYYAVYAKPLTDRAEYRFGGFVSDLYDFEGNDIMVNRIKQSISDVGTPIFQETHYMNWPRYTSMSKEIIIQNGQSDPRVGDIYPHIAVRNTYDGRGSKEVTFGLSLYEAGTRNRMYGFTFSLCSMKQMHHEYARSRVSSNIGGYLQAFTANIKDLISMNFGAQVQEDVLLSIFDVVEKVGKRRREEVSTYLAELKKQNQSINAWDLFLAITRFSTLEKNLNAKILMENIAERVLVLPVELERALKTLRSRGR